MSAYGAIVRANAPTAQLPPLSYPLKADPSLVLSIHHVTLAQTPPEVLQLLHVAFNEELERGRTYPQEGPMDLATYSGYFFAADVFIGVLVPAAAAIAVRTLVEAQAGRPWSDCLAGAYYVKPNYPGRSAHACNGGFFVLPAARGKGCGTVLGQSYVINAPLLGYKASVFNLVYCSNEASVRIWDSLGFQKIGRIPRVGRLKKLDGTGDEYVDAWVVWKEFETPSAE